MFDDSRFWQPRGAAGVDVEEVVVVADHLLLAEGAGGGGGEGLGEADTG